MKEQLPQQQLPIVFTTKELRLKLQREVSTVIKDSQQLLLLRSFYIALIMAFTQAGMQQMTLLFIWQKNLGMCLKKNMKSCAHEYVNNGIIGNDYPDASFILYKNYNL